MPEIVIKILETNSPAIIYNHLTRKQIRDGLDPYEYEPTDEQVTNVNRIHGTTITPKEMNEDIARYWGSFEKEKLFLLPFWRADELIEESTELPDENGIDMRAIALCVNNIEDPKRVKAKWMGFDRNNFVFEHEDSSISVFKVPNAYFIPWKEGEDLDFSEFRSYIRHEGAGGGTIGDHSYNELMIIGRMIKRPNDEIGVVFIVGAIDFKIDPPVHRKGGPEGNGSGIKLP